MHRRPLGLVLLTLATAACSSYRAPALRTSPVPATPIESSAGRTWDALVEYVAERLLSIELIDRSSGLLAVATREGFSTPTPPARQSLVVLGDTTIANCGSQGSTRYGAGEARYNILVRGDSSSSRVMVNAAFKSAGLESYRWCVSTGRFEQMVGEQIRSRVQDRR